MIWSLYYYLGKLLYNFILCYNNTASSHLVVQWDNDVCALQDGRTFASYLLFFTKIFLSPYIEMQDILILTLWLYLYLFLVRFRLRSITGCFIKLGTYHFTKIGHIFLLVRNILLDIFCGSCVLTRNRLKGLIFTVITRTPTLRWLQMAAERTNRQTFWAKKVFAPVANR